MLREVQLFDASDALPTPRVVNPNGVEQVAGRRFFWLGRNEATVHFYSPVTGTAELVIDGVFGSSLVGSQRRRLAIGANPGPVAVVETRGAPIRVDLPVRAGWGRLSLKALDAPDTVLANDPRTLLYGVRSLVLRVPRAAVGQAR